MHESAWKIIRRKSKQEQVERIAARVEDFLRTEIALTDLVSPRLTQKQRRAVYTEVCRRARLVLLG